MQFQPHCVQNPKQCSKFLIEVSHGEVVTDKLADAKALLWLHDTFKNVLRIYIYDFSTTRPDYIPKTERIYGMTID